jgi:apolipoprotein N-acyltransferase
MRALESGRSLMRVTNTGVTSFIGADGRVQAMAQQFKRQVLTHEVQAYSGATPYVRWQNYLLIGGGLIALFVLYRRQVKAVNKHPE